MSNKLKVVTKKLNHRKCKAQLTLNILLTNAYSIQASHPKTLALSLRNTGQVLFPLFLLSGYILQTLVLKKIQKTLLIKKIMLEELTVSIHSNKNS